MADKHILHMLTPLRHMSPFDVNMALDAGFDAAIPYTEVTLGDVSGLVQDAMFSRPPKTGVKTGVFIGGKKALAALDMLAGRQEGAGAAIRHFVLCRSGRFFHHGGGNGRLRREAAARQERQAAQGCSHRGIWCNRRRRVFRRGHRRASRRRRHSRRL